MSDDFYDIKMLAAQPDASAGDLASRPAGFASMTEFIFEPIEVNSTAPGGAVTLRTFDDIGLFILTSVDVTRRLSPRWNAVRWDLVQTRFGKRRAEVHQATRHALAAEGWLAD
jgi:hypothetical protein